MSIVSRLAHLFTENQIMIVFLGILMGFFYPEIFQPISAYGTAILMLIFFTSSLRLSLGEFAGYAKDWKMLSLTSFFKLLFLPIAMWLPCALFAPEWALPFLIVGAVPTGMTIALIAEYFGGKTTLALVVTAVTSLLAPFTIPIVFQIVLGQSIPIPTFKLFTDLLLTIVVPFGAAAIVQNLATGFVKKHDVWWRQISIIAFGILLAAIVADTTAGSTVVLGWDEIGILFVMLIYIGGLTWLGYVMDYWRTPPEKATIALCMVYMNNTLALFIGNRYFSNEGVVPRLVIILMIVNFLLPPIRMLAKRAIKESTALPPPQKFQPFSLP